MFVVDDRYKNAVGKGAEIVLGIKEEDYGGRGYTFKDLEVYLWSCLRYDPWER